MEERWASGAAAGPSRAVSAPALGGGAGEAPREPTQSHVLLRSDHPQVELSWSTCMFSDRPKVLASGAPPPTRM